MTTLTTLPQFPVPGRDCQLSFALTESGSNYLRVWVTDAPQGSEKKALLEKNGETRIPFYTGDAKPITFKPDKGGVYKLLCQEYVKGSGYGGAYEGDPNGAPSETKVGAEVTVDLVVGQRVTQTLGYGVDQATLVWWIFGTYVRPTTLATHGEDTPAVIDPTSLRAQIAAKDPSVQVYTGNSANSLVTDLVGDISAIAADIVGKLHSHQINPTPHHTTDTDNILPDGLATSVGPKNLAEVMNRVFAIFRAHLLNVDGNDGGDIGSAPFHQLTSITRSDRTNLPIVESVGDLGQAYASIGDYVRCHEGHLANLAVHSSADSANNLIPMPALVRIHRYFFQALAALSPTVPPTMNSGVVTAASLAGFIES